MWKNDLTTPLQNKVASPTARKKSKAWQGGRSAKSGSNEIESFRVVVCLYFCLKVCSESLYTYRDGSQRTAIARQQGEEKIERNGTARISDASRKWRQCGNNFGMVVGCHHPIKYYRGVCDRQRSDLLSGTLLLRSII